MIAHSKPDFFDTLQDTIVDSLAEGGFFDLNPGQKIYFSSKGRKYTLQRILEGEAVSHRDADALVAVPSGWDTSTTDQIMENLETWKKRVQNEKGFRRPHPVLVSLTAFGRCSVPFDLEPEEKPVKAGQTRRGSLLESLVNILVGYSINFVANLLILPLFGWHISTRENLTLGVIYTGISLVRSYGLRRLFNWRAVRK